LLDVASGCQQTAIHCCNTSLKIGTTTSQITTLYVMLGAG
jgi:hypothetical protein